MWIRSSPTFLKNAFFCSLWDWQVKIFIFHTGNKTSYWRNFYFCWDVFFIFLWLIFIALIGNTWQATIFVASNKKTLRNIKNFRQQLATFHETLIKSFSLLLQWEHSFTSRLEVFPFSWIPSLWDFESRVISAVLIAGVTFKNFSSSSISFAKSKSS